ncbi:MAG TPA: hypothetical protein VGI45_14780 [Terracidiphilus sp.]
MLWELWQRLLYTWKFQRIRMIGYFLMFVLVALIITWLMLREV